MADKQSKPSAIQVLNEFLQANNIELTQTPLSQMTALISDGSFMIKKPEIGARYKDARR